MDEKNITCWTCKKNMLNKDKYYICLNCNPEQKIEECIDGCFYVCQKCQEPVPIGVDKDYNCTWCNDIICINCIIFLEDDIIFCSKSCQDTYKENQDIKKIKITWRRPEYDQESDEIWESIQIDSNEFLDNIINPDEIIFKNEIDVIFSYPLNDAYEFKLINNNHGGITRYDLLNFIKKTYNDIYKQEEETASQQVWEFNDETYTGKVLPMELRLKNCLFMNRHKTDGTYGIWGHDLGDLYLEGLQYNETTKKLYLSIGL